MDYNKVHMYREFIRAIIVKDTTIDLVSKGELCAFMSQMSRVMEELMRVASNDDEDVDSLIDWIETCSYQEQRITNLNEDIAGLNMEIERLKELNNNQARMLLK